MSEHDTAPAAEEDWPPRLWRRLDHLAEQALDLPVDLDTPPADELALLTWRALRATRDSVDPLAAYLRALPQSTYRSGRQIQAALQSLEGADDEERARIRRELVIYHLPVVARRAWSRQSTAVPLTALISAGNQALVELMDRMPPPKDSTMAFRHRVVAAVWGAMSRLETAAGTVGSGSGDTGPGPTSASSP